MDYYELLGVSKTASPEEIKKAYKKLARENHPDATGNDKAKTDFFKKVTAAYEMLLDPNSRARYNARKPNQPPPKPTPKPRAKPKPKPVPPDSPTPPEKDIWGEPLSEDEKRLWVLENVETYKSWAYTDELIKLREKIKKQKKANLATKKKPDEGPTFYNDPEEAVFTPEPVNGMHFHNPSLFPKKSD